MLQMTFEMPNVVSARLGLFVVSIAFLVQIVATSGRACTFSSMWLSCAKLRGLGVGLQSPNWFDWPKADGARLDASSLHPPHSTTGRSDQHYA